MAERVSCQLRDVYRSGGRVALDTETDGSDNQGGNLVAVSLAYLSADHTDGGVFVLDARSTGVEPLSVLADVRLVAHMASFDAGVLLRAGLYLPLWADTAVLDGLLYQGRAGRNFHPSLRTLADRELGWTLDKELQLSFDRPGPLTRSQVVYAALDAVAALFCWNEMYSRLPPELHRVLVAEHAALPSLVEMSVSGLPFAAAEWAEFLTGTELRRAEIERRLINLTEASPDDAEKLAWNPRSGPQLIETLNRFEAEAVRRANGGSLLPPRASTDKQTLGRLSANGSAIAEEVLALRSEEKLLSTYGEGLLAHVGSDGRLHPSYTQCVTATGRLTSSSPNAQNLDPRVKPFIKAPPGRVFVSADLSQAELRVLAAITGDETLTEAFRSSADVHTTTAAGMFGLNPAELAQRVADGDAEATSLRKKGKVLNFATIYGQGPRALADTLTDAGVPTSVAEARQLLEAYAGTYPTVDDWLRSRDAACGAFAEDALRRLDWELSVTLEPAHGFDRVCLDSDGDPVLLVSTTRLGRRRLFDVSVDDWFAGQAATVLASANSQMRSTVADWLGSSPPPGRWFSSAQARKLVGSDRLREFVSHIWETYPQHADRLREKGFSHAVSGLRNAYRNHPIQGGVADVMMLGLGRLHRWLHAEVPSARTVASIHDSVVVECATEDAALVASRCQDILTASFSDVYPEVPLVVDVSTSRSFE